MSALLESPFFGVTLTVIAYWAGVKIQRRTGLVICNYMLVAVALTLAAGAAPTPAPTPGR